jgi:hypothetical protein
MRKYFFFFLLFPAALLLHAQTNKEDVLYLKNGSIIRGQIIDQLTDGKLKIELLGGSIFVFEAKDIDSIRKENPVRTTLKEIRHNYYRKDHGFRNITELAIIYGVNFKNNPNSGNYYYYSNTNQDDIGLSLQTVNGYQFWPYLFVGGGVGIDRFITYQQTFSPFFVRLTSEFLKRKVTPYVYVDAGYSVMWKQPSTENISYLQSAGGAYTAAGAGLRIYTRSRASVMLSAGYKMNMSKTSWTYAGDTYDTYNIQRTYQRFVMNFGVSF